MSEKTQFSVTEIQDAHHVLMTAERHRLDGEPDRAQNLYELLLDQNPDYTAALISLSLIHMERQTYAAALPHLVRAAMLNPRDWPTLANLAKVYLELGAPERAIHYFDKSLELEPDERSTRLSLGWALIDQSQFHRAAEVLEPMRNPASDDTSTPLLLCNCYLELRRYEEAAETLNQALKLPLDRDEQATAYMLASYFPERIKLDFDLLGALDNWKASNPDGDDTSQVMVAFARALCLERLSQHEESWRELITINATLAKKNAALRQSYFEQADELLAISQSWTPSPNSSQGAADNLPVVLYIVGASRSGKTSLENLVAVLPGVTTGFEHNLVRDTAKRVSERAGLLTLDYICRLPREFDTAISETYRNLLRNNVPDTKLLTVTHPGVLPDVGRLTDCVQNARFVFVKRNADDNALRIFGRAYTDDSNAWANDVGEIYTYISHRHKMIDHWLDKLGNKAILVDYAEMVEDPDAMLEQLAKFCGVEKPDVPAQRIHDDRGCAKPYQKWLDASRDEKKVV